MMEPLEIQLKTLKFRSPSSTLDDRVLGQKPPKSFFPHIESVSISLGWVTAFALLMGMIGFVAGALWRGPSAALDSPPREIRVIYNLPPSQNPFILTHDSDNIPQIPAGKWEIHIQQSGGV